jgi:hypothetical protein
VSHSLSILNKRTVNSGSPGVQQVFTRATAIYDAGPLRENIFEHRCLPFPDYGSTSAIPFKPAW